MALRLIKVMLVILLIYCSESCSSLGMIQKNGQNSFDELITNVIDDYCSKSNTIGFKVFNIVERPINDTILDYHHISISPAISRYYMGNEINKIGEPVQGGFPTEYWVKNNLLFVYTNYSGVVKKEVVDVLRTYNVLDTVENIINIDETLEGVNYFICKNNINKMVTIKSSKAIYKKEHYREIDCECSARRSVSK